MGWDGLEWNSANEPCPCGRVDAKSGSCCGVFPLDESSEDLIDPRAVLWRRFHPNLRTCEKVSQVKWR